MEATDQLAECLAETLRKRHGDLPSALQMTGWSEVITMLSPISSTSEVPAALMWRVPSSTCAVVSVMLPHSPVVTDAPVGRVRIRDSSRLWQVPTFNGI